MTWVKRAPKRHVCSLLPQGTFNPPGQPGDLWRCDDCGLLWRIRYKSYPFGGTRWARAPWWLRLRYRRTS